MVTVVSTLVVAGLLAVPVLALVYFCWITENWEFLGACGVAVCMVCFVACVLFMCGCVVVFCRFLCFLVVSNPI